MSACGEPNMLEHSTSTDLPAENVSSYVFFQSLRETIPSTIMISHALLLVISRA